MIPYIRFRHKADIYGRNITIADSGQKKHTWVIETAGAKTDYINEPGNVRLNPTVEDLVMVVANFPPETNIDSSKRVYNFTDRKGNIIDAGPYEVLSVKIETSFQGFIRYYEVILRQVIEP